MLQVFRGPTVHDQATQEISTASWRWTRCLPTSSPLLGDLVSSCAHAEQHYPPPARHGGPNTALELPAPPLLQTCRWTKDVPPHPGSSSPLCPLIWCWLGPRSPDGCQHRLPPPPLPPAGHLCRSPSPARRTQSSQSSRKSFPAAQGSAKLSLPPKFMEKQVPASEAQYNREVEQAVLTGCRKGSCSLLC